MAQEAHKLAIFRGLLKFKSNQQKNLGGSDFFIHSNYR